MDYTLSENDKANRAYATKVITDVLHAAEAQDVLTIQRFAHLISGARMGQDPALTIMALSRLAQCMANGAAMDDAAQAGRTRAKVGSQ
jgi:hypothetical protein